MTDEELIDIRNIDVFKGTFKAIWDVSLQVKRGEMIDMIGANN